MLYWAIAPLVCLALYWNGLLAWFQQDDFAWLALLGEVNVKRSFLSSLVEPMAQGTIRPISERLFFMSFFAMFGLDALPYRIWVFLTMSAALGMLTALTRRLTGSSLAGLFAGLFWTANASLQVPMSWTSAYNQVLCSLTLLTSTYLWVRYTETPRPRFLVGTWAVFLIGFGVLELNVVFPAVALLYALCRAPARWKPTIPMFAVSVVYTIIHRAANIHPPGETYRMYYDASVLSTLWTYLRWVVGADQIARAHRLDMLPFYAAEAFVWTAMLWFAASRMRRRDRLPLFFLGWFFGILAPLLPLKNHISDYYLVIPSIGLAALAGWGLSEALRKSAAVKVAAIACAIAYAVPSAWAAHIGTEFNYRGARLVKAFLQKLASIGERHPDKIVLIRGMSNELFWNGYYNSPFRLFGNQKVYLTADTQARIVPFPELGPISQYFLPYAAALHGLQTNQIVVYEMIDHQLRNVTELYRRMLTMNDIPPPGRIEFGSTLFDSQIGEGWYSAEEGFRWMQTKGGFQMGPPASSEQLVLSGACPQQHKAAVHLKVRANGIDLGSRTIAPGEVFSVTFEVPPALSAANKLDLTLETDQVLKLSTDQRELSLAFVTAEFTK